MAKPESLATPTDRGLTVSGSETAQATTLLRLAVDNRSTLERCWVKQTELDRLVGYSRRKREDLFGPFDLARGLGPRLVLAFGKLGFIDFRHRYHRSRIHTGLLAHPLFGSRNDAGELTGQLGLVDLTDVTQSPGDFAPELGVPSGSVKEMAEPRPQLVDLRGSHRQTGVGVDDEPGNDG